MDLEINDTQRLQFVRSYLDHKSIIKASEAIGHPKRGAKAYGENLLIDPRTKDLLAHEEGIRLTAAKASMAYALATAYEAAERARASGHVRDMLRAAEVLKALLDTYGGNDSQGITIILQNLKVRG